MCFTSPRLAFAVAEAVTLSMSLAWSPVIECPPGRPATAAPNAAAVPPTMNARLVVRCFAGSPALPLCSGLSCSVTGLSLYWVCPALGVLH
jgi:hypothetical protein